MVRAQKQQKVLKIATVASHRDNAALIAALKKTRHSWGFVALLRDKVSAQQCLVLQKSSASASSLHS